jgi:4-carboxymuconolactone decarboxylase
VTALAVLTAARNINSDYLWAAHEAAAYKAGIEASIVDALRTNRVPTGVSERDAAVLRFGRELFVDRRVSTPTFVEAVRLFGAAGVADLSAVMAFQEFVLYSSIVPFELPPPAAQRSLLPTS